VKAIAKQFDGKAAFTPMGKKPYPLRLVKKRGGGLRPQPSFLTGFTIIELLTVMSVIIILISLLVPGLTALKRYAKNVVQKNQFHAIEVAIESFNAEWQGYPDSDAQNGMCGATRLTEAMVGRDLLGYDPTGTYATDDLSGRKQYLTSDKADVYKLSDLYPAFGSFFTGNELVLCDAFTNVTHKVTGKLIGMPVLYYKADTSKTQQFSGPNPNNIYNFLDNNELIGLGVPWSPTGAQHPLYNNAVLFSDMIWDKSITTIRRPYRADSYILISAGYDGLYGTKDDILNFRK